MYLETFASFLPTYINTGITIELKEKYISRTPRLVDVLISADKQLIENQKHKLT